MKCNIPRGTFFLKFFRPMLFNNGILHAIFLYVASDFLYDRIQDSTVIEEIARVLTHGIVPFKIYMNEGMIMKSPFPEYPCAI